MHSAPIGMIAASDVERIAMRFYPRVTKAWMEEEKMLAEKMGLEFWGKCDPQFFSEIEKAREKKKFVLNEKIKCVRNYLRRKKDFNFHERKVLFNRFLIEFVDFENKVILVGRRLKKNEAMIYKSFKFQVFRIDSDFDLNHCESIWKEIIKCQK